MLHYQQDMADMENTPEKQDSKCKENKDNTNTTATDVKRKAKTDALRLNIVKTDNKTEIPVQSLSPKTPSSSYTTSVLECCKGCFIKAFVLCHWDNIVGPKISHVWKLSPDFETPHKMLNMIAIQTLNGEICRDPVDPNIDTKYFILRDFTVVISSYVFGAADRGDLGVHSLSLLIPFERKTSYFALTDLCAQWTKRIVGKMKIFLEKEPADVATALLSTQLFYFVQMLLSLKEAGLPSHIALCDSHFHPEHKIDPSFLRRAITSHLITGGRSIIIGPNTSQVNLMISTLAMFLPSSERARCRYVTQKTFYPYHPELPIQGLLQNQEGQLMTSLKDIYLSSFPSALIDLTTRDVRISSYVHKHYLARHKALIQELDCLWRGKRNENYPTSDMFHVPDDPETLVKNFLEDLDLVPPSTGLKEKYIDNFVRYLEKKAFALIKFVEVESDHGKKPNVIKRKKVKQDLSLTVPGDFKIVLAIADKLQPGFYGFLYQDRIKDYVSAQDINQSPMKSSPSFSDSFI